jgi:hypothetical protein
MSDDEVTISALCHMCRKESSRITGYIMGETYEEQRARVLGELEETGWYISERVTLCPEHRPKGNC